MIKEEELKIECWNRALMTLGTSYVFSKRVTKYKRLIRLITVLGIVVPLLLGGVVATYGTNSTILVLTLAIAGPISITQLVLSGVSLVYKWDDLLAYSLESQTDNRQLSDSYKHLAKSSSVDLNDFNFQFNILKAKEEARTNQDDKVSFSDKENRLGMRYGLFIFKRKCEGCKAQPISMKATQCGICGNF
jgi:mobilome CxxCx(11)CxxC protein